MSRTHLKDIFSRDMSQFLLAQGMTTKMYPLVLRGGDDAVPAKIGHILSGCGDFLAPLRCIFVAVHKARLPCCALRDKKIPRNATRSISSR